MIEAGEAAPQFLHGRKRADLDTDRMFEFALVRAVEIVGEAGAAVSQAYRDKIPLPWTQIVAMRNRLIHGYADIDRDIVWKTATEEIPALLSVLRRHAASA
ncbi:MAG: HepT-like ribonuclease domain-containing protein [Parvularculaceae bacterium]